MTSSHVLTALAADSMTTRRRDAERVRPPAPADLPPAHVTTRVPVIPRRPVRRASQLRARWLCRRAARAAAGRNPSSSATSCTE